MIQKEDNLSSYKQVKNVKINKAHHNAYFCLLLGGDL